MTLSPLPTLGAALLLLLAPLAQADGDPVAPPEPADLRKGYSAARLLGADVRGTNAERLGHVEDILVDRAGRAAAIVVKEGGVGIIDVSDVRYRVPWREAELGHSGDYVKVPLHKDNLESYVMPGHDRALQSVATMLEERILLRRGGVYGRVADLVLSPEGALRAMVISPRRADERYAVAWRPMRRSPGWVRLPWDLGELKALPPFDYAAYGIAGPPSASTGD